MGLKREEDKTGKEEAEAEKKARRTWVRQMPIELLFRPRASSLHCAASDF